MKITHNNLTIEIDNYYFNPREWDNNCKMVFFHKGLGDKHNINHKDYSSWDELKNGLNKIYGNIHTILPVYLLDQPNLKITTNKLSEQIGFVFINDKTLEEKNIREIHVPHIIEHEINVYNNSISGEMYQFTIKNDKGETLVKFSGFSGKEHCIEQAKKYIEKYLHI